MQNYKCYELGRETVENATVISAKCKKSAAKLYAKRCDDLSLECVGDNRTIMVQVENDKNLNWYQFVVEVKIIISYEIVKEIVKD